MPSDVAEGHDRCFTCRLPHLEGERQAAAAGVGAMPTEAADDDTLTKIAFEAPATGHFRLGALPRVGGVRGVDAEVDVVMPNDLDGIKGGIISMGGRNKADATCSIEVNGVEIVLSRVISESMRGTLF